MAIVFFYREQSETFAVDESGFIGRPDIGMKPSSAWRFDGLANGHGSRLFDHKGVVAALASGQALSGYVLDIDHGTSRLHGAKAELRLAGSAPSDCAAIAARVERERLEATRERLEAATREALKRLEREPVCFKLGSLAFPIELRREARERFAVIYGKQVREGLSYSEAARELGAAIMHALNCDGELG